MKENSNKNDNSFGGKEYDGKSTFHLVKMDHSLQNKKLSKKNLKKINQKYERYSFIQFILFLDSIRNQKSFFLLHFFLILKKICSNNGIQAQIRG